MLVVLLRRAYWLELDRPWSRHLSGAWVCQEPSERGAPQDGPAGAQPGSEPAHVIDLQLLSQLLADRWASLRGPEALRKGLPPLLDRPHSPQLVLRVIGELVNCESGVKLAHSGVPDALAKILLAALPPTRRPSLQVLEELLRGPVSARPRLVTLAVQTLFPATSPTRTQLLTGYARELLEQSKCGDKAVAKLMGAISFIRQHELAAEFEYAALVPPLLATNHHGLPKDLWALQLALERGRLGEAMSQLAQTNSRLAVRCLHGLGLEPECYPDILEQERNKYLKWLVHQDKAAEFGPEVCKTVEAQKFLLSRLAQERKLRDFGLLCEQFGLQDAKDEFRETFKQYNVQRAELKRQADAALQAERQSTWQLPAGFEILMVNDRKGCQLAAQHLLQATQVGLDSESAPDLDFGAIDRTNKPALLQVSSRCKGFLFDLLPEGYFPEADEVLTHLFQRTDILKIGFRFQEADLAALRRLGWSAFKQIRNFLDLHELVACVGVKDEASDAKIGLSQLCQDLLHLPLSKSMQLSSWQRRPLRDAQLQYAASDSAVLLILFDALEQLVLDRTSADRLSHSLRGRTFSDLVQIVVKNI
eukprot:g31221.t1